MNVSCVVFALRGTSALFCFHAAIMFYANPALTSANHARFVECLSRASYPLTMQWIQMSHQATSSRSWHVDHSIRTSTCCASNTLIASRGRQTIPAMDEVERKARISFVSELSRGQSRAVPRAQSLFSDSITGRKCELVDSHPYMAPARITTRIAEFPGESCQMCCTWTVVFQQGWFLTADRGTRGCSNCFFYRVHTKDLTSSVLTS